MSDWPQSSALVPSKLLAPSTALSETWSRDTPNGLGGGGSDAGKLALRAIPLLAGMPITSISIPSGTSGLGGGQTHWYFALYDGSRNLLRQTADQTTAAWAGSTLKTLSLSSGYTVTQDGMYYIGVAVVGSSHPNYVNRLSAFSAGGFGNTGLSALTPTLCGLSNTGLTTGVAPNPANAPGTTSVDLGYDFYAFVS